MRGWQPCAERLLMAGTLSGYALFEGCQSRVNVQGDFDNDKNGHSYKNAGAYICQLTSFYAKILHEEYNFLNPTT